LASEIPLRTMKYVDIGGREIALVNIDGRFYAIEERCRHMNALMSKGQIRVNDEKKIIICPLHYDTFNIVTGR
jgi:nitrite reductase/ring-hydroxylating ferredoxin subunit